MSGVALVLVGLVGLFLVVFLGWRLVSTRQSLPCPAWLSWLVELDNPLFRNNRAAAIIAGLDLEPGMRALDVGCGPGRLAIPMARRVGAEGGVLAVDLQPEMLAKARSRAEALDLRNIAFRRAKVGVGELDAQGFDRAVLVTVLGEIPDQCAALAEIFAALKPGGRLAVTEVIADPHFQRRSAVLALAMAAGFRERARVGGPLSYTLYLERPRSGPARPVAL